MSAVKAGTCSACGRFRITKGMAMKIQCGARVAAVSLLILLPLGAHSAGSESMSADDLASASERIRQTGAQLQADIKQARARHEAQQAKQDAERKREAELARLQATQETNHRQAQEAAQARAHQEAAAKAERAEREKQKLAEKVERERQLALAAQDKIAQRQAAKQRAVEALREARASVGESAF